MNILKQVALVPNFCSRKSRLLLYAVVQTNYLLRALYRKITEIYFSKSIHSYRQIKYNVLRISYRKKKKKKSLKLYFYLKCQTELNAIKQLNLKCAYMCIYFTKSRIYLFYACYRYHKLVFNSLLKIHLYFLF